MSESIALIPLALLLAGGFGICITILPRTILFTLLILLRSVSDVGSSSAGGELLPSTAINSFVTISVIIAALAPSATQVSARARNVAIVVLSAVGFWMLITIYNFGYRFEYAYEFVRMTSLVAVFVLAYRIGVERGGLEVPRLLNWMVGIPSTILIVGYIADIAPTLNTTGRGVGTFSQANAAAAFFAVGVISCIWGYWMTKKKSSLAVATSALVALLFTQSLGALVGVGFGAVILFALNSRLSVSRRLILIFFGLAAGLLLFISIGASSRLESFQTINYNDDAEDSNSLDWRFTNWRLLLPIWWVRAPLQGLGWASTRYEVQPLGELPHSIVVQILVEVGLIGFLLVATLVAVLVKSIQRRFPQNPATGAALAAVSATVFIHGVAANWLNYSVAPYLALFALGAMLGLSRTSQRDTQLRHAAVGDPSLASEPG